MPTLHVAKGAWDEIISSTRHETGVHDYPPYACFMRYGVCPNAIITQFSMLIFNAYMACAGVSRLITPDQYYQLPALYVEAVGVINEEWQEWEVKK